MKVRASLHICTILPGGWLGRAMVLGSFQCWGVLLLWHMVGQGPAVLVVEWLALPTSVSTPDFGPQSRGFESR